MKNLIVPILLCVMAYLGYNASTSAADGLSEEQIAQADRIVNTFMRRYSVPGLSLAWAKDGEVILSRAYGVSSSENNIALTTNHLFRIASISKPITSVLIMRLVEQGRLSLEDTIFGPQGLLANEYRTKDRNTLLLTVRHLLEHGAGEEWSNERDDPMFRQPVYTHQELIQWVLDTRPLSRAPGTSYHYSNFGYSVLGRVIEKVTGTSYEAHFLQLLAPLEISDFKLASNFSSGGNREVQYYSQESMQPYSFPARRMDAHGGWVTSPSSLVRFLLHVDGFPEQPDILQTATLNEMTVPGLNNGNYAKGWSVNQYNNWWHTGSLPGTATVAVRTSDNMVWAVFLNTRSPEPSFFADLDGLMWHVVQQLGML